MRKVQHVFISNVFGSSNRGDAALVEVLAEEIQRAFGRNVRISGFAYEPDLQIEHLPNVHWYEAPGRSRQGNKIRKILENVYFELLGFVHIASPSLARIGGLPTRQAAGMAALRESDLVVSCAGGFLHDANISIYFNLSQLLFAKFLGKYTLIAPQTIGPIQTAPARLFTKFTLSKLDKIYVRERISLDFCKNDLGIGGDKVEFLPDLALYHGDADYEGGAQALVSLGCNTDFITLTALDWEFPDQPDRTAAQQRYIDSLVTAVDTLFESTGLPVLILNQVRSDLWVGEAIAAKSKAKIYLDQSERSPQVMRGIIRKARAMIASRFHSCVFALLEGTPVRAISYNYKTDGIMEDLGLSDRVSSINGFDGSALAHDIISDTHNRESVAELINARMASMGELRLSEKLKELL